MARITMRKAQETKLSEVFTLYLASAAARGVKDKTLRTYEQHFNAISKRLDVETNISLITSKHLDKMILRMREDGLSDSSINSYTRTLKVFFSWCNEQGYTKTNLKIYKASETVKETYTDDELMTLLKKPDSDCKFCEYRNWVIVNFLLNSGCRAATVRNIQNQDVDLSRKQIVLRHTTPTDNAIIEAINGWIKEELFLDFGLATAKDVPRLLDEYVHYYNYERPAAALGYKSPVQYKTELGF